MSHNLAPLEFRDIEKEQMKPDVLDPAEEARRIMRANEADAAKREDFARQREELRLREEQKIWERYSRS